MNERDDRLELFEWLMSEMVGSVTVRSDGSREPQIAWYFPIDVMYLRGPTPLEALRIAHERRLQEKRA